MYRNVIIIFIFSSIAYCLASVLTPTEFDNLSGRSFCSENDSTMYYNMCVEMGDKFSYADYVTEWLKNLSCEWEKVYLLPNEEGASYQSRDALLLECIFQWGTDKRFREVKFIGRGDTGNDVFLYSRDSDGDITAEGHYIGFLEGY